MFQTFGRLGLMTVLGLASACVVIEDNDEGGADETSSEASEASEASNDESNNDSNNDDSNDDDPELCEDACANLESCGIPLDQCLAFCSPDACGMCLANSDACGEDCIEACEGGDGDGDPTTGDGDGDGDVPPTECVINDDCGLSFECVACNLNDSEGWCEQSMECSFDEDCGFGGKCGYNVETGDWRCLPAEYCR